MSNAIEISQGSKFPEKITEGQVLQLDLIGMLNSIAKFQKIDVQRKDYNIYLNAYATYPKDSAIAGIGAGWKKIIKIDGLKAGLYTLYFNNAFGYIKWSRTLTVEKRP